MTSERWHDDTRPGDGAHEPASSVPITEHPLYGFLEAIIALLGDALDHPEAWSALDGLGRDHRQALRELVTGIIAFQTPAVIKPMRILLALIEVLDGARVEGLAALRQLEADFALCPQVAGAIFFADRHGDPARSADLSARFCEAPFVKFETLIDGTVAPCCSIWTQKRLGTLGAMRAEEIWNGADAQEMRESILDGSFRFCNKQRCTFIREDALPLRSAVSDPALRAAIDGNLTILPQAPRWLFLAHDSTCNLACPSCRSDLMGASEAEERRFDIIEQQVFEPMLARGALTLSLSGQGDPFASHHYRSILRRIAEQDYALTLDLHTNALLLNEERWQAYAGLEKYRPLVNVSIDACTPEVYEIVRRPGKWDRLAPNLAFIAAKRAAGTFREFHMNATIQLDNFHQMPAMMAHAEALGADSMRLYMMQNTGAHLSADFARKNVADRSHPLHLAFLETLRDPALARPVAHLYDVAGWRDQAHAETLPSDALGARADYQMWLDAIDAAIGAGRLDAVIALCIAARRHFNEALLCTIEAQALRRLGFTLQASYRDADRRRAS